MPLFQIDNRRKASQIKRVDLPSEKNIQVFCEKNLKSLFNIRFVASEFSTGQKHGGRIDTLGLDENNLPVIIEYKKKKSQNIITQGFYYLDWLIDHKGDFEVAAQNALKNKASIDWSGPRLILIAESFSKYDTHAVTKMGQNVDLKTYRFYDGNLFYFEDIYTTAADQPKKGGKKAKKNVRKQDDISDHLKDKSPNVSSLFQELREAILSLSGEEKIRESVTKLYIAYKSNKNFCEINVQKKAIKIYIDIDISLLSDPKGIAEDCSKVGRWATGKTRFSIISDDEIEYALSLIQQAYSLTL